MSCDDIYRLRSNDGQLFTVLGRAVRCSKTLRDMLVDVANDTETVIDLPTVDGRTLNNVMVYCGTHTGEVIPPETWDATFFEGMPQEQKLSILLAANYLDIPSLLDASIDAYAKEFVGTSAADVLKRLCLATGMSAEEIAAIESAESWAKL
jgi:hypothetical protein